MQTGIWIDGKGRKIRICDMNDDHLFNTLCLLQRWCNQRRGKLSFDEAVKPLFWCLLDEAEERKIVEFMEIEDMGKITLKRVKE